MLSAGLSSQEGTSPRDPKLSEMKADIVKLGSSSRLAELEGLLLGLSRLQETNVGWSLISFYCFRTSVTA